MSPDPSGPPEYLREQLRRQCRQHWPDRRRAGPAFPFRLIGSVGYSVPFLTPRSAMFDPTDPRPVPFPSKPGPEPCNQIADTLAEQLARARRGRGKKGRPTPAMLGPLRRLVRRWLVDHFDALTESLLDLAARLDRVERRLGEGRR